MNVEDLSPSHKQLLELKDASRVLQGKEGQKIVEYFKIMGDYYFPHSQERMDRTEGMRGAACFLDLLVRGFDQTPEVFLANMDQFTANWKS
jgi:hypothetical protein